MNIDEIKPGVIYRDENGFLVVPIFCRDGLYEVCFINGNQKREDGLSGFIKIDSLLGEDKDYLANLTLFTDKVSWLDIDKLILETFSEEK